MLLFLTLRTSTYMHARRLKVARILQVSSYNITQFLPRNRETESRAYLTDPALV